MRTRCLLTQRPERDRRGCGATAAYLLVSSTMNGDASPVADSRVGISRPKEASVLYVPSIWVEELRISEQVARKIMCKHHISPRQVRGAVCQVSGLYFAWDFDPERGARALVRAYLDPDLAPSSADLASICDDAGASAAGDREDYEALIVLYPTDNPADQAWRLGSAYYTRG
jgi:hypothetical protein